MNKESLEKELADLQKQKQQLIANINAIEGAVMLCNKFIAEIDKPKEQPDAGAKK